MAPMTFDIFMSSLAYTNAIHDSADTVANIMKFYPTTSASAGNARPAISAELC